MLPRKALSSARIATMAAALTVAAFLIPGTASAATGTPVLTVTTHALQQARTGVHPDTFSNCTVSTSGDIAVTPGTTLGQGVSLCSGNYELAMQNDGNLVVYGPSGAPLWYSGTANGATTWAAMQTDGNFVVYAGNSVPLWNAQTGGHPGAYVCFQTDGNLVVYPANSTGQYTCTGADLWNSNS